MARIRNGSGAGSASNPRKRAAESQSPARSPKRRQDLDLDLGFTPFSREASPTKSVHWGRGSRIISGPTITDPQRRSQSPTRPALRSPVRQAEGHGYGEDSEYDEHDGHGPSAQLQDDIDGCLAEIVAPPAKRAPAKEAAQSKKRQPGVGSIVVSSSAKGRNGKASAQALVSDDSQICKDLDELKTKIGAFVQAFPNRPKKAQSDVLSHLVRPENEQLVRYIGCIAMGGKGGAEGWQELLTDDAARKAVIWGVLGKALKENVFDSLYFGARPQLEAKLKSKEQEQALQDGFYRQRSRSDEITKQETIHSDTENDVPFLRAVVRVLIGMEALLLPLWTLGGKGEDVWTSQSMRDKLFAIVAHAGQLARDMRRARDVVYYWPPTLKDEEFEPPRMECVNLNEMIRTSPYDRREVHGRDRPILRKGHDKESQAIVRVVCFPGVQAFRQGAGELAKRLLAAETREGDADGDHAPPDVLEARRRNRPTDRYGKALTGSEGIRTRVVSKGVVLLQWGRQRLLTKEAGTSVHIDAMKDGTMEKYVEDAAGHVELMRLFEERTASARASPAKVGGFGSPQRSPSLVERGLNWVRGGIMGTSDEVVDEEEEDVDCKDEIDSDEDSEDLPIADFDRQHRQRELERQRARVGVPVNPRSRKAR